MLVYTNDTDADVKLVLPPKEGEELPTELTVKPGDSLELTDEQAKYFLTYDLQAKKTEGEGSEPTPEGDALAGKKVAEGDAPKDDDGKKDEDEDETGKGDAPKDDEKVAEETKELAEERATLAEERRKLAEEKAEMKFQKLCEAGKAVPAQKKAFMALAVREETIALAEGKTESVSKLLENLFESAPATHSLMKEAGDSGEGEAEPELTDEEKKVAETFGNSEDDIKKMKKEEA